MHTYSWENSHGFEALLGRQDKVAYSSLAVKIAFLIKIPFCSISSHSAGDVTNFFNVNSIAIQICADNSANLHKERNDLNTSL